MFMKGRLGMIVCPILEDEAIYNIETDPDVRHIYLVDNEYNSTIVRKLDQHGISYTMISQNDALSGKYDSDGYTVLIWMMFEGLHAALDMLRLEVMNQVVMMCGCVDTIMLYYGRCGRALDGIMEWARTTVPIPVIIFRNSDGSMCDDCICVPVGGTDNYLKLMRRYPGRVYCTPAIAANFEGVNAISELVSMFGMEDHEMMKMMLEMAGYTELVEMNTGLGDQVNYDSNIRDISAKYHLKPIRIEDGWTSTYLADLNYSNAKKTLCRWLETGDKVPVFEVE